MRDIANANHLLDLFLLRVAKTPTKEAIRGFKDGYWKAYSWQEYKKSVFKTAKGISDWVAFGDRVCLLSRNCVEWVIADLAIMALGGISVPIFPTSPSKDLEYILNDSGAKLLLVSNCEQFETIKELLADGRLPELKRVVFFEPHSACDDQRFFSWKAVQERGKEQSDEELEKRIDQLDRSSLATIIYTSGTTGVPKGVMLSHNNFLSNVVGLKRFFDQAKVKDAQMLSLLPLSHSFERTLGHILAILMGFQVAYPVGGKDQVYQNLKDVKPTILIGVPLLYEGIYTEVLQKARNSSISKKMLAWCIEVAHERAAYFVSEQKPGFFSQTKHKLAEKILFEALREGLGGRLRFAISGGASLPKKLASFFLGSGIPLLEGYGLTEASPVLTANPIGGIRLGSVGKPLHNVKIRIKQSSTYERGGEILFSGPNQMLGYYQKDEETAAILTDENWIRTGDVGYLDSDGYLFLTDRKKELLKTMNGKYVAPQPIEKQLRSHSLIEQAVVIGDGRRYCIALLVPNFRLLASELTLSMPVSNADICAHPNAPLVFQEILDEVNRGLGRWEQVRKVLLLPERLCQETGELTPTMKLKRRVIDQKFLKQIEAIYST